MDGCDAPGQHHVLIAAVVILETVTGTAPHNVPAGSESWVHSEASGGKRWIRLVPFFPRA